MQRMIIATGNEGKMKEIREILAGMTLKGEEVRILSMKEAGVEISVEENGQSFAENAMIKARAIAELCRDAVVLADDSGLEVDYLNKEPGIYTARYLGENASQYEKNMSLISRLEGVARQKRTARFVCAVAGVLPDGRSLCTQETVEGWIGYEERGKNGFGYDPIFMLPDRDLTTAELTEEEKNRISHRGKAFRAMKKQIEAVMKDGCEGQRGCGEVLV